MALSNGLTGLTIREARKLLDSRRVSSVELAQAHLEDMDLISADAAFDSQTERRLW